MSQTILSLKNVSIYQENNLIVSDINLEVQKGEFLYFIGKTGSGKSSLMKVLYADLPLKEGEGTIVDYNLNTLKEKDIPFLRRKIGIVFQDFKLLSDRSIKENLLFVLKATGWKDENLMNDKIADVLNKVGLKTKGFKMPFEMSGGEQQRVDIARALLNSPRLILADEPTGNLDPQTSDEIMQLLFHISKDYGTAIVMATHDYMVINKFPARTIKTESGKVVDNASITQ